MTKKNSIKWNMHLSILMIILFSYVNLNSTGTVPDIIVYGNEKCGYCGETMKWLKNQNISFIYKDVETYGTNQEEMFSKLEKAGFTSTAYFPVLDINGQILMKPGFDDIKKALSGQIISSHSEKKFRESLWRPDKIKSLKTDFASVKKNLSKTDITVYDDGTGSGKPLLKELKKEQIPFTLIQLNKLGNAAYFDMSSQLSSLGYGNIILFPVVKIRGEMIMKPSIDEVRIFIVEMIAE